MVPEPDTPQPDDTGDPQPVTTAAVGKLAEDVEKATGVAKDATQAAEALAAPLTEILSEVRSDRTWRKWLKRFLAIFGVALTVAFIIGIFLAVHLLTVINDVKNIQNSQTSANCSATSQTLGCENHRILVEIENATGPKAQQQSAAQIAQIVEEITTMVDCRLRGDLAEALKVTLPATSRCPAVSPSS